MIENAKKVRMLLLDVDGVLTDGSLPYSDRGQESKSFNVKDGLGVRMLINGGIKVAIISGRKSRAVEYRAKDLGIHEVHQGIKDKVSIFDEILKRNKLNPEEICFVGDDLIDLPLLNRVGFAVGVSDAVKEVRKAVDYVTRLPGGKGAVREVCELVLKSQKKWKRCFKQLQ
jgi:3-deoxy-D-manno-octulosonate 8-phosphate phosphatase (KDO 8-P phosphatase)